MKFLLKIVFFAALVLIAFVLFSSKNHLSGSFKNLLNPQALQQLTRTDMANLGPQVSSALDALVTHQSSASPVILGLQVTNQSLNTIVDIIQRLPPGQMTQLKSMICAPAATPSAK